MIPPARNIRAWLRKGFDTVSLARRWDCSEADLWNALASELSPSATGMPHVAGRLAPVKGLASSLTGPGASASGRFSGGVVGGLVHAKAQLRDLKRGEDAKLLPVVRH